MSCNLSEEELWSGLDRNAPEVERHVALCEECQNRAAGFRAGVDAVTQASIPSNPPLPERVGSYVIHRRLGEGGMGIVYEGEQQTPRRLVAVKVVRGGQYVDETRVRLFQREVETLARLRHPAIASIYDAGRTEDGQHFFAMELVRGQELTAYVRDHGVPRRERLELFCKICDALHYAHLRGVIHRDLKPTNILVDAEGSPKILDFGLARIIDPDSGLATTGTEIGRIMGTLPYMSPEEARGNPFEIDVRCDVYSLGVIFYELMTGQLPYAVNRTVLHEAVRVICEEPPRRPSTLDHALRGELETIALKALEKERGRRYQSAAAIAEDIHRYLTDQPILARRPSVLYRLRKFARRHKLVLGFVAVMFLVVASVSYTVVRAERERFDSLALRDDLESLRLAIVQNRLATSLRAEGKHAEAEREYREALTTYDRLGRQDYAGLARLDLGAMLIEQGDPARLDDAQTLVLRALDLFDESPPMRLEARVEGLEALQRLYGPDMWDVPEARARIETELVELRAEQAAGPKDQTPPPPPGM